MNTLSRRVRDDARVAAREFRSRVEDDGRVGDGIRQIASRHLRQPPPSTSA